ncbi:MAG: GtrA family protein [Sphingomonadales bacterium]|nr:GtrA family protein [Sphingomonadales bacterium]
MLERSVVWQKLQPSQQVYLLQIIRYGVSGLALTALMSGIYLLLVNNAHMLPALSVTLSTIFASVVGFFVHGNFSFRGHGDRANPGRRFVRFLTTNAIGYFLNVGFVILMTGVLRLPTWTPTIAFCTVTPIVAFLLCRRWVFG